MEGTGGGLLSAPPAGSRQVFPEFGRKPCSWRERAAHEAASLEPGQPGTRAHTCACTHRHQYTQHTCTHMHMYTHAHTCVNTPVHVQLAVAFLRALSASAARMLHTDSLARSLAPGHRSAVFLGPRSAPPARVSAGTPGPHGFLWGLHSTFHICQPSPLPPYPISFMPTSAFNFLNKV